jgi:hypothetical protein
MVSILPTVSLRLAEVLASPLRFTIPAYQRPYSWTIDQAGQLLEDLTESAGVGDADVFEPDYFLGTILLLDTARDSEFPVTVSSAPRTFEIVDGQQRLVTLTILAAVLRDAIADMNSPEWRRLDAMIIDDMPAVIGRYQNFRIELRGAEKTFFAQYVQQRGASRSVPSSPALGVGERGILEARNHFIAALTSMSENDRLLLANYILGACHLVVIRTHDIDRAHRLFKILNERGKPLQRNDILKADVLADVPAQRMDQSVAAWDRAADRLGAEFENLFSHIRTIFGKSKKQIIAGVRDIMDEVGGGEKLLSDVVTPYANAYHLILGARDIETPLEPDVRRHLIYLSRLSGEDWIPPALLALRDYHREPARAALIIKEIDRLAHLLRLLSIGSGKRIRRFSAVVEAMKSRAPILSGDGPFRLSREELRGLQYHFRDLYGRNQQMCKLLLLRLNDEIAGSTAILDPSKYSVEHVLPQRPHATSEWMRWFPVTEARQAATNCLGNLVVVSPRQNDRARNQEFARKQEVYRWPDDGTEVLPITRDAIDAKAWGPAEIEAREQRLLTLVGNLWDLDLDAPRAARFGPMGVA